MERRLLAPGLEVSILSLGSWRTYERVSREAAVAVLREARASGIDFVEVARYDDESGRAPIPTGWSEVVFGEAFRRSGWPRDEVAIATKLWWEFWPRQTSAQELDASLGRTGLDRFDFVYSDPPPAAHPLEQVVAELAAFVTSGRARAWGVVNWPAASLARAAEIAREAALPGPSAIQLAYHAAHLADVEAPAMEAALAGADARLVASHVLAGGVLTGKYESAGAGGRHAGDVDSAGFARKRATARALGELADELGTDRTALALGVALLHPRLGSLLMGATDPAQVRANVAAVAAFAGLDEAARARLRALVARAPAA